MTAIDEHVIRHRRATRDELFARLRHATDTAARHTAGEDLAQLARVVLGENADPLETATWQAVFYLATGEHWRNANAPRPIGPKPAMPAGILSAEQRAELEPLAATLTLAEQTDAGTFYELELAGDGDTRFGLSDAEIAAAKLAISKDAEDEHLQHLAEQVREHGRKLAEIGGTAPTTNPPGGIDAPLLINYPGA